MVTVSDGSMSNTAEVNVSVTAAPVTVTPEDKKSSGGSFGFVAMLMLLVAGSRRKVAIKRG